MNKKNLLDKKYNYDIEPFLTIMHQTLKYKSYKIMI